MSKQKKSNEQPASHGQAGPEGDAELGFEAALSRLSEIVDKLEHGDLPLDTSLELFEEGVRLARLSQSRLDQAERRVEQLLSVDDDGQPIVKTLDG